MKPSVTCLLLVLLSATPAVAQELTTGTIAGKVTDPAGSPIAGAVVIVVSESGTRPATTDANGITSCHFSAPRRSRSASKRRAASPPPSGTMSLSD